MTPATALATVLAVGTLAFGSIAFAARATPERALFALVIGTNHSRNPASAALRYADDDAVQNATLLRELGAEVVLLVELDADSRPLCCIPASLPVLQRSTLSRQEWLSSTEGLTRLGRVLLLRIARPVPSCWQSLPDGVSLVERGNLHPRSRMPSR
ncbi:MAG: hypothetical protein V2A73_17460 [Pseudomonadota bacterium]